MRTGAIFARGSCRALKWMALAGVVFTLGAGQAAAQETARALTGATFEIEDTTPMEGATSMANTITATLSAEVPGGSTTATTVTITVTAAGLDSTVAEQLAALQNLGATPAEDGDWTIADDDSSTDGTNAEFTFVFPKNETTSSVRHSVTDDVVLQTGNTDADAEDEALRLTGTAMTVSETDPPDLADGTVTAPFTPTVVVGVAGSTALDPTDTTQYIKIDDKDTQTYVLTRTVPVTPPNEGDAITVTIEAMPGHVQGATTLTLQLGTPAFGYELGTITGGNAPSGAMVTLGDPDTADNTPIVAGATDATNKATIPLTATADASNDGNRVDDTLTLSAYSGVGMPAEDSLSIVLADLHALPAITAALTDANGMAVTDGMLMEGMTYMLTLSAPAAVSEDITVSVMKASGTADPMDDYSLGQSLIMIPSGQTSSAAVSLEVDLNDDIENDTLVFMAEVAGEAANGTETDTIAMLLSLTLVDATTKLITVAAGAMDAIYDAIEAAEGDGNINVGELVSIPRAELFDTEVGYTARISAASSDTAVAQVLDREGLSYDPESVQIHPSGVGTAKITITGTAVPEASSVFTGRNLSRDVAEIMFDVEVVLGAPGPPRNLLAIEGDQQVSLSWDPPNEGGAHSGYQSRYDAGAWMDLTADARGYIYTGLTNGVAYVFEVRAINESGMSEAVSVKATPKAAPLGPQVVVKSVSAATSVPEAGGLEVTVTATVPAGTKGADGKVAPLSRHLYVWFPTDDASIAAGDEAEDDDLTVLGDLVWEKIPRTEKASEAKYTFRVAIGQDLDAEDEQFQVSVAIDGDYKRSKVVTIDDAEEQTWVLSLPSAAKGAIKEGAAATKLTLEAEPAKTFNIAFLLELDPNDPSKYTLGGSARGRVGLDAFETTIAAKADSNREDDTVTVTAYTERDGELASLDITVTDVNALPAVKATLVGADGKALDPQPMSVAEGETVKVMLTAVDKDGKAMKAAEKLSVSLMPTGMADAADYRLSTHPIEIAKDKESSAAVDLMITEDQDLGEEDLTFTATVSGDAKIGPGTRSVMGVLSLMITDATDKLVWAKTQAEVEAAIYAAKEAGMGDDMIFSKGEMIEVMGGLLFNAAEGVTLSYTAESDMSDVASTSVSGGMVMVMAMAEGMAHITITAHASMPSGVKILDQTDPGMASVLFPVEVGLEALSIMLMGPEDMNLAEGMSAEVTATANRAVTTDTMVMLMRDRAMSSASDDDFMAEAITIMAGEMMGSTMVMAVEDNMMEDMEELVLYGMTEGMAGEVTGEVKLYLWDAAVPALPIIAQLLLAAFLAVGGYRRYRRR